MNNYLNMKYAIVTPTTHLKSAQTKIWIKPTDMHLFIELKLIIRKFTLKIFIHGIQIPGKKNFLSLTANLRHLDFIGTKIRNIIFDSPIISLPSPGYFIKQCCFERQIVSDGISPPLFEAHFGVLVEDACVYVLECHFFAFAGKYDAFYYFSV